MVALIAPLQLEPPAGSGGSPYREPPPTPTVQELAARIDAIDAALATTNAKAESAVAALEGVLRSLGAMQAEVAHDRRYREALGEIARGGKTATEAEWIARAALEGR